MKVVITQALRLRQRDVVRLAEVQKRQFFMMVAPARAAAGDDFDFALESIEDGDDEGGDYGLLYVRLEDASDPARAFEGWFLDWGRWPMTEGKPDTGEIFFAGTIESTGVRMAQHGIDALADNALGPPLVSAVTHLKKVVVKGAAMKADPPFALAKAPKPPKRPVSDAAPLRLEVVSARRWTEHEIRSAPPEVRFQVLHAFRPRFATKTHEGMDAFLAIGILYSGFDPGPRVHDAGYFVPGPRAGVVSLRVRDRDDPSNVFDGWFMDESLTEASYWPSTTATIDTGRWFFADGVKWTGVALEKGKVKVDPKKATPISDALAGGLRALGRTFTVEVPLKASPGVTGYFGSAPHAKELAAREASKGS